MSKRYVQHISGQGEKWRVHDEDDNLPLAWRVVNSLGEVNFYLPKSEYRPCEPPEVWKDVTEECEVTPTGLVRIINRDKTHTYLMEDRGYRFRKVSLYDTDFAATARTAFIIEKKVSE